MTSSLAHAAVAGILLAAAGPPVAGQSGRAAPADLVVSTEWLAAHRGDPDIVLLQVDRSDSAYLAGHIPGARFLGYAGIIAEVNGVLAELPPADSLRRLFEAAGVSTATHVVLTGQPLMVTRAFFTLDLLGHARVSVLDGGLTRWKAEGREVTREAPPPGRGSLAVRPRPELVASAEWVMARVGKAGVSLVDARTDGEYLGTGERPGQRSNGHIPGARRLEWQDLFQRPDEFALKDRDLLARLWAERAAPGDTVVAYCLTGIRASSAFFVSRLLGHPVKLYDGSYDEWAKKNLPLEKAATPLRSP